MHTEAHSQQMHSVHSVVQTRIHALPNALVSMNIGSEKNESENKHT